MTAAPSRSALQMAFLLLWLMAFPEIDVGEQTIGQGNANEVSWSFLPGHQAAPAENPLKGFVPYSGRGSGFPHSLEFHYVALNEVVKAPELLDWTVLENILNSISSRGCQSIVRFHLEYPGKPTGVPAYLVEQGLKMRPWMDGNTVSPPLVVQQTPDYEDPRLVLALTHFIAGFGHRFDGDARLGFIEAGLLGSWGEWHCHPHSEWFASKSTQHEVLEAYQRAFHQTPVLVRYPSGPDHPVWAPNHQSAFGYHDDSFAWATLETGRKSDEWFYLSALRKAGPMAESRWKTAPIGGEIRPELWPCLWKDSGCDHGQDFLECVAQTHVSWLMDSSTSRPLHPEERKRAIRAAQSLGYELTVESVQIVRAGTHLKAVVTLRNLGVAPFYADWPVQLRVVGLGKTAAHVQVPISLKSLLPGSRASGEVHLHLAEGKMEGLDLVIGIPNPMTNGAPVRLANVNTDERIPGWLTLGPIR